jgi:hypothetical protein
MMQSQELHENRRKSFLTSSKQSRVFPVFRRLRLSFGSGPNDLLALALIVFCVLIGNFLFASEFGLYEDDHLFVLPAFSWSWQQCWNYVVQPFLSWPQGRPLGFALTSVVSYITAQFNTLLPGYLIGAGLIILNGYLFFKLLRPVVQFPGALAGALVLVLYPADCSKQILEMRIFQHFNLTVLLAALLLYQQRHYVFAYCAATLCLLIYEHFFFPFLLAPFLLKAGEKPRIKKAALHLLLCGLIPFAIIFLRRFLGEERATGILDQPSLLSSRIPTAIVIGPLSSGAALLTRAADALDRSDALEWILMLVGAVVIFLAFRRTERNAYQGSRPPIEPLRLGWLALGALLAWASSYVLAFRPANFPPVLTLGRLSGFNAPGSIGASVLVGLVCALGLRMLNDRMQVLWTAAVSLYLSSLLSAGIQIQRFDYVRNWNQQKVLLQQMIATSGEWKPDTTILVDYATPASSKWRTPGFSANWFEPYAPGILQYLVDLHKSRPDLNRLYLPVAYGITPQTKVVVENGNLLLQTPSWNPAWWPRIAPGTPICFTLSRNGLERVEHGFKVGNLTIEPKPSRKADANCLPTRAYRVCFRTPRPWPSIQRGRSYPQ